jgi:hypothetical protein
MFKMFDHPNTVPSMLNEIKHSCGIFLSQPHYERMIQLPEHSIRVFWNHKDKLKNLLIFHNHSFDQLFQMTAHNLNTFFDTAKIGPCGDVESTIHIILKRQNSCPPETIVYAPPQYVPYPPVHHHPAPPHFPSIPPVYPHPFPPGHHRPGHHHQGHHHPGNHHQEHHHHGSHHPMQSHAHAVDAPHQSGDIPVRNSFAPK